MQRVERILEEKEAHIGELQRGEAALSQSLERASGEKQLLIEALYSKDLIIREFQAKLNELLQQRSGPAEREEAAVKEAEVQTDPLPEPFPADEMYGLMQRNSQLLSELEE